jgi:hypothetical protein
MRRFLAGAALLAAVVGVLLISEGASATNAIQDNFTNAYPATQGTALASCSTCHTSVPALNPYGSAVRASGFNFGSIESLDADGDGFTNLEEIQALTNPGDASDHPVVTTTTTSTTTTTTTMATPTPSTTTTTTTTLPQTPVTAPAADAMAFDAGPAGTVWLAVEDGRLVVIEVETTWSYEIEVEFDDDEHEIEIEFRNGDQEVEFKAELEDGQIETEVELENDDDHDDDDDDHHSRDHDDDHDDDDDDEESEDD